MIFCTFFILNVSGPTNGFAGRFLGFSLYVSNTPFVTYGGLGLCFHETTHTVNTIPAVFNVSCPVQGRYVVYHNSRSPHGGEPSDYSDYAFSDLCEVEVYGM
jgi:hypothetical protein